MCFKWGKVNSTYFNVSNRVRQGRALSPKLFATYVDDLSYELISTKCGCYTCMDTMYESYYVMSCYVHSRVGSSTVDQVLKYIKYPNYIPSTNIGQVLICFKVFKYIKHFYIMYKYKYK